MPQDKNKYINMMRAEDDSRKQKLQASMHVSSAINPDNRAKSENLSTATNIPLDVVERNPQEVGRIAATQDNKYIKLMKENPKLSEWLSNPENSAVAHDDLENMSTMEWLFKAPVKAFEQGSATVELGRLGTKSMREGLSGKEEGHILELRKVLSADLGADSFFSKAYTGAYKMAPMMGAVMEKGLERGLEVGGGFAAITALAGQVGPQVAIPEEIITVPSAFLSGMAIGGTYGSFEAASTLEGGHAFLEFRDIVDEQGAKIDIGVAKVAAEAVGVANGVIELLGLGVLARSMPGAGKLMSYMSRGAVKQALMKPTVRVALANLVKRFGTVWTAEVAQEVAQEAITILGGEIAKETAEGEFEGMTSEEIGDRLKETAIMSAQEFALISAIGPGSRFVIDANRAKKAKQREKVFEAMSEGGKASKLRGRLPERFKDYVESVTKDGPVTDVYINAKEFAEYFQENDIDTGDLAQKIPEVFEQLNEALSLGGDLVVPIADFTTYIAPSEHFEGLKGSLRLRPDDMTMNEAAVFEDTKETFAEEIEPTDVRVFDTVFEQLRTAGRSIDVARAEATGVAAFFNTMAERTGQDSIELMKAQGIVVKGPIPETLKARDINDLDLLIDEIRGDKLPKQQEAFGNTLLEFARKRGIKDDRGDLAAMDVDIAKMPGMRNLMREDGQSIDDVALAAQEAGFFDELEEERVTINQFLDAVADELKGQPKFADGDKEAQDRLALADDLNKFLDERGIDINTATNEEIKAALQEVEIEGKELSQQQFFQNRKEIAVTPIESIKTTLTNPEIKKLLEVKRTTLKTAPRTIVSAAIDDGALTEQDRLVAVSFLEQMDKIRNDRGKLMRHTPDPLDVAKRMRIDKKPSTLKKKEESREKEKRRTDEETAVINKASKALGWAKDLTESAHMDLAIYGIPDRDNENSGALNATLESITRHVKKRGWSVRYRSGKAKSGGSVYIQIPNKGEVRVSDHELPDTAQRRSTLETLGVRWDDELILGREWRTKTIDGYLNDIEALVTEGEGRELFQKAPKGPRGSIVFADKETIIKLTESANLSTFLHESGHLYLEMFKNMQDKAPQQMQDDFQIIKDYLGVKDEITTEQHEKWARSFEAYLFEGKAPSVGLADAFARFRSWLITVYRQITKLGVELTPEIRGVMDRMLATDDEIAAAERQMVVDPIFSSAEEGGMTEAEFKAYNNAVDQASQDAANQVIRKSLNELKRTQAKWWKAEEASTRKEVEKGVYTNKTYQAWHLLTKGKFYEGVTPEEVANVKLSRSALIEQYGEEILKYLPKSVPPIFGKKDGVSIDDLALLFDMSGAELIKGLTNLPPPKQVIDQQVKATMLERHGDIMNDGGIQEEAIAAVHGDKRGQVLALELQGLNRKGGNKEPSAASVAKAAAKRIIVTKKTNDAIAFSRYAAAETRAAKETEQFIAKGDFRGAAEAKRRQLLNHYMFIEARNASEKVTSILNYTQKFNKKGVRKNISPDYLEQIDDILNRFDFRKSVSLKAIGRRESLKAFVAVKEAEGEPIVIPQSVLDEAERRSYKDMPLEEVYGVNDALKNLQHLGRKKEEYIRNQKKRSLQADANLIAESLEKNVKEIISPENSRTVWEMTKKTGREYMGILTKAQTYIEAMDGGPMGVVYDILKRDIDEASIATTQRLEKMADDFTEIVAKHYPGTFLKSIKSLNGDKVYIPERNYSYSKAERIAIALNMGNEGNSIKFMTGRKMSQGTVDKILSKENFSENDWAFVQSVWDYMDSYFGEISVLEKERTGFAPEKVKAEAINTPYGQIRGGYYPISYDSSLSLRAYAHETEALYEKMKGGSFARAQTKHGFTKARTEDVDRAIRIDLGVIGQHLNQVIIDLEMSRAVESASAILHHKTTEKAIKSHLGMEAFQMLDLWIMDVAVGGIQKQDGLSIILSSLRSSVSVGAMAWKYATFMIQLSGFSHTVVELGPKYTYRGLMAMKKKLPWDVMNDVYEMSPFMKIRATTLQRDMADVMKKMEGRSNDIARTYFWPIVKMQQMVDMPTWLGAYEKGLAEGKSDKDAIRFADLMVEKAQGSGLMSTLSGIERGTTMKQFRLSESVKMWTSFYSYFNTKLNIAMRKTKQTSFKDPIQVARLASDYIMLFWLEAIIGELMLSRDPDFEVEDDPEKAMIKWNLALIGGQIAASFPLLREVSGAMRGFSGAPGGARALEDVGSSTVMLGKEIVKIVDDEEVNVIKAIQNALKLANVVSPVKIPVSQINTTLEAIDRESKGEDVKPIDYLRRPPR